MADKLYQWNEMLEKKEAAQIPVQQLFSLWIWDSDPNEELIPGVLLNTNQLAGLLYCRVRASTGHYHSSPNLQGNMRLEQVTPDKMNLQTLLNALDNVCIEWPLFMKKHPMENNTAKAIFHFVDQCVLRFGTLASYAQSADIMNVSMLTEEHFQDKSLRKLTLTGIRRFVNLFLLLFRHFHLFSKAIHIPPEHIDCGIRRPHLEASMESFDLLCMHMFIPVGARLRYKNEFRGMYNHISQVMYFHNSKYSRMERVDLTQINVDTDPIQLLPALRELHPEIPLLFEEDDFLRHSADVWTWVLVAGRIYFLSPTKEIFFSSCLSSLFHLCKK